jgi:hypothetical protein
MDLVPSNIADRGNAIINHYNEVSLRVHARLLVREALYDGRRKPERALRKAMRNAMAKADRKVLVLSRLITGLLDPRVRAVA